MKVSTTFLIAALAFINSAGVTIVNSILAVYLHDFLRVPLRDVGVIVSVLFVTSILLKVPVGIFLKGDRATKIIPLAFAVISASNFGYYFARDANMMIMLRLLNGVGLGIAFTTLITTASLSAPKERVSDALAHYTAALALGLLVGPILGTGFASLIGVGELFLVASIVSASGVAIGVELARRKPIRDAQLFGGKSPRSFHELMSLSFSRRILLPSISNFTFIYLFNVMITYAPILGTSEYGLKPSDITLIFVGYFAVAAVGRLLITRLLTKLSVRWLLILGLSSSSFGILLASFGGSLEFFVSGFIVVAIGHGWVNPATSIVIARYTSVEERSVGNSVYLTYLDLGSFVGPLVAASLVTDLGMPGVLALSAILPFVGIASAATINVSHGERVTR